MLKVSAPYVRETPITHEGKPVVIRIDPPGYAIGFRLRHSKQTYYLNVADAFMAARYGKEPQIKQEKPKSLKNSSYKDEVMRVLETHKRLNIAQVMKQLKEKGLALDRRMAGDILELLKETGKVKQEGFDYSLTR